MAVAEEAALHVLHRLREAGHVAYFAGGCVRDRLLGLAPKDYDVATDAPPKRVRSLFERTQAVGQAFGVVLVHDFFGVPIEVATFRTDGAYFDGRHPESVTFADAEHDAQRRDFTINALFYDPVHGRVIDYVNGQHDLENHVLRTVGDPARRFAEDHLRMLRAIRFASRLGFAMDPTTASTIAQHAGWLASISSERVADELRRMLTPSTRKTAYEQLWSLGLANIILRDLPGTIARQIDHDRSIFLALHEPQPISPSLALLAMALDALWHANGSADPISQLAPGSFRATCNVLQRSLKLSNDETHAIADMGSWTHRLLTTSNAGVALGKRFLARPHATSARQLMEAMRAVGVMESRMDALRPWLDDLAGQEIAPPPLLTGDALVAAGYAPGPAFKQVIEATYDAQLESRVKTSAEALELARKMFERTRS